MILQHDLWALFDWVASEDDDVLRKQRRELETRLSEAIRRLALTSEQFRTLPDTYEASVAARAFAPVYDSQNTQQPFLPPDLFRPDDLWVCLTARSVQPTVVASTACGSGRNECPNRSGRPGTVSIRRPPQGLLSSNGSNP